MQKSILYFALAAFLSLGMMAAQQSATSTQDKSAAKEANKAGKVKTVHQVTGCISGPNDEGVYLLKNGHYKEGLEIGGDDALKDHVGHYVTLTGTWATGKEIGENESSEGKMEKAESKVAMMHHDFKVTSIKMKSETCPTPGAAMHHKKAKTTAPTT